MNWLVRLVCTICGLWMLLYCLIGGTRAGKEALYDGLNEMVGDKAGTPLSTLVLPILMAGTTASLLLLRPSEAFTYHTRKDPSIQYPPRQRRRWPMIWRRHVSGPDYLHGDPDFGCWGVVWIVIPCTMFAVTSVYRNLSESSTAVWRTPETVKGVANSWGIAALVALAVVLLPVAKHSCLLSRWNHAAAAVKLHIWAGRCVMAFVVLHAGFHLARWRYLLQEEHLWSLFVIPVQCWTIQPNTDISASGCHTTDCTCYSRARNFTGLLAALSLAIIGVSSLQPVRRRFYAAFYNIHVLAGPTLLLCVVLHWNRSIIYMAGGLLYYVACSFPVLVEQWWKQRKSRPCGGGGGVQVVAVELIRTVARPCVAITFTASDLALQQYRAGHYIQLYVPSISAVAHPFSVNTTTSTNNNTLRLIVRCTGPFTTALARQLTAAATPPLASFDDDDNDESNKSDIMKGCSTTLPSTLIPVMHVNGFYGCPNRVQQVLHHDVVVLVAGGIGITAYLSLLHEVYAMAASASRQNGRVGVKKVILHWTCRDPSLIAYIKREYLDPLVLLESRRRHRTSSNKFRLQILIHKTGEGIIKGGRDESAKSASRLALYDNTQLENYTSQVVHDGHENNAVMLFTIPTALQRGFPFEPSVYAPGSKHSYRGNAASFLSFAAIAWGGLAGIWYFYIKWQTKNTTLARLCAPVFVVVLGVVISLSVHWWFTESSCGRNFCGGSNDALEPSAGWTLIKTDEDETESSLELGCVSGSAEATALPSFGPAIAVSCEAESRVKTSVDALDDGSVNVQLEEREGRPTVYQFLNSLDGARCPGVFACGPSSLLDDIRTATKERCLIRFRQCIRGESYIALYEEAFEM